MPIHLLNNSDWELLKEIVQDYRRKKLQPINRNPALPNDIQEILAPEDYIALTPPEGIPALTLSSDIGSGTPPLKRDRPGSAFCYVYVLREDDFGEERLYAIEQEPKKVINLLNIAIPGLAWITISRDKFGTYKLPSQGFKFRRCGTEPPGTGTGSGTGTGTGTGTRTNPPGQGDCWWNGLCGDIGVVLSLTATITNKQGCFTSAPDIINFSCFNPPSTSGVHRYGCTDATVFCGGNPMYHNLPSPPSQGWCIDKNSGGGGDTPNLYLENMGAHIGIFTPIIAQDGWTCNPMSAVFLVDNGSGDSCTVTAVE